MTRTRATPAKPHGLSTTDPAKVFDARGGVAQLTPTTLTPHDVPDMVERMLKSSGRWVDLSK